MRQPQQVGICPQNIRLPQEVSKKSELFKNLLKLYNLRIPYIFNVSETSTAIFKRVNVVLKLIVNYFYLISTKAFLRSQNPTSSNLQNFSKQISQLLNMNL